MDGFIVVDLPPEEEGEFCLPTTAAGMNFIYLTAPTTTDERLPRVLKNASGFVYFVSITGITGTHSANTDAVAGHVARIRNMTDLPVAVGFGINTPEQAAEIAGIAVPQSWAQPWSISSLKTWTPMIIRRRARADKVLDLVKDLAAEFGARAYELVKKRHPAKIAPACGG